MVEDLKGNVDSSTIVTKVDANLPGVMTFDKSHFRTFPEVAPDAAGIENLVKEIEYKGKSISSFKIVEDDGYGLGQRTGTYDMDYELYELDGTTGSLTKKEGSLSIEVLSLTGEEEVEEELSGWDKFWKAFAEFFIRLWRWLTFRGWTLPGE